MRSGALTVFIAVGAIVITQVPTVSVNEITVRTPVIVGLISGILLVPSIISHYRSRNNRKAIRWALFAFGIPLSLTQRSPFNLLGVLAVLLSVALAWDIDHRLFRTTSQ